MLAAVVTVVAGHSAEAQSLDPATVTVSDFGSVVLDGSAATTTATMSDFSVTDSVGDGWQVSVRATSFAEVDQSGIYVPGGKRLPPGSLTMSPPTIAPSHGSIAVAAGPYLLDGTTVQIISAQPGVIGTFSVTQTGPLTLTVPASAFARDYRSDVTVEVRSGP